MKIAFIVSSFPALSETFILNQIVGLIDCKHDLYIFASNKLGDSKIYSDVMRYDFLSRTYYWHMPASKILRVIKAIRLILTNFHRDPLAILKSLNVIKYGKEALSLYLLYAVIPFLGRRSFDIIHCHFGPNGRLGVLLREIGVIKGKIITTFHGYDVNVINEPAQYAKLFYQGDLFTVNTNFTKRKVMELGGNPKKILKLPVGLSLDKFIFKEKSIEPGGEIRILTVARLVEKKGLCYSIRAVAKIIRKYSSYNLKYRIAGEGPLESNLKSLISELEILDSVQLLGPCGQDEVRRLYQQSHIFLLSSVTANNGDREGQGLVLQEAQAMGLPIVSTLHNGIPEGVLDGKSGFLVPEKDVNALAEKLGYLIEHPEIWPEMGRAGRRFVEENYDINKLNDQLVEIYRNLLDGELP